MKKLFFAIVCFFAVAMNASANGYCNTRPSQQEIIRCYQANVQMQVNLVTRSYERFLKSPNYTPQQKQLLYQNQLQWAQTVQSQCNNNLPCLEKSYYDRNIGLMGEYQRTGGK